MGVFHVSTSTRNFPDSERHPARWIPIPLTEPRPISGNFVEQLEFEARHWQWINYSTHKDNKPLASEYAFELHKAIHTHDKRRISILQAHLNALRIPDFEQLLGRELWDNCAQTQAESIPFAGIVTPHIVNRLAQKLDKQQNVLEAMCGSYSYISDLPGREVVELDFSHRLLELHSCPSRTRICANIEHDLPELIRMFPNKFTAISITLGLKYLRNPVSTLRGLRDLLTPDGIIICTESRNAGYHHAMPTKLPISHAWWAHTAHNAGYQRIKSEQLPRQEYFMFEASV